MGAGFQSGDEFRFSRQMTAAVHQAFLECSLDDNPLHVDDMYAKSRGYPGKLMYGALLNAMVSGLVGSALPTRDTMCLSQKIAFRRPFFLDETVELTAKVAAVQCAPIAGKQVLELSLDFRVADRLIATGVAEVMAGE